MRSESTHRSKNLSLRSLIKGQRALLWQWKAFCHWVFSSHQLTQNQSSARGKDSTKAPGNSRKLGGAQPGTTICHLCFIDSVISRETGSEGWLCSKGAYHQVWQCESACMWFSCPWCQWKPERAPCPLRFELQSLEHHMGAGNQPMSAGRTASEWS